MKGRIRNNELNLYLNLKKNKNNKSLKTGFEASKEINKNLEMKFTDFEINYFNNKMALNFDKRNYCEYYKSLMRMKHPIIFSFVPVKDYNTLIIKVNLFFFSFSVYYAVNLLFFTNEIIHQIYESGGDYEIKYFLKKIIYSFIISSFFSNLIKFIFLSERNILEIKEASSLNQLYDVAEKVKRSLVIKYTIFFILGIIFLSFFWMFLSSFGAVYQNTQKYVVENTMISFGISFIFPFIINLVPGCLRISAIKSKSKDENMLYKISIILQWL